MNFWKLHWLLNYRKAQFGRWSVWSSYVVWKNYKSVSGPDSGQILFDSKQIRLGSGQVRIDSSQIRFDSGQIPPESIQFESSSSWFEVDPTWLVLTQVRFSSFGFGPIRFRWVPSWLRFYWPDSGILLIWFGSFTDLSQVVYALSNVNVIVKPGSFDLKQVDYRLDFIQNFSPVCSAISRQQLSLSPLSC